MSAERLHMWDCEEHDLFPTMVLVFHNFLSDDERKIMLDWSRHTKKSNHRALDGDAVSSHGYDNPIKDFPIVNAIEEMVNTCDGCGSLASKIGEALNNYSNRSGFMLTELKNSWINIQHRDSNLRSHRHAGSAISGALYLNVDDDSSQIYFDNPNPYIQFNSVNQDTQYTFEWYRFKPENGMLILFPGWLSHGSRGEVNKSNERVVLSFNTWWRE